MMRRRGISLYLFLALCLAAFPAAASAQGYGRTLIHGLREGTEAEALAVGDGGDLWFAGSRQNDDPGNVIARITPDGQVHEYGVPETAGELGIGDLVRGTEGDMWFTEPAANRIVRVSPSGAARSITLPTPGSLPTGITVAPDDSLWVTLEGAAGVVKVEPGRAVTEYALSAGSRPGAITYGPESALWAIEGGSVGLTQISTAGVAGDYPLPTSGEKYAGAINSDITAFGEELWVAQSDGPYVGQVDFASGTPHYSRHRVPVKGGTSLVAPGPDGDIWFASGNEIGSIDSEGDTGEAGCVTEGCGEPIKALAEGPDGKLYFAVGSSIGTFRPAPLTAFVPRTIPRAKPRSSPIVLECRGGAAGEACAGEVELLRRHGRRGADAKPLGRTDFKILSQRRGKLRVPLTGAAAALLARKGSIRVRLVVSVGKTTTKRNYRLRAAR
jgi:virginiamycin B lyase